jgi:hypothetical protein
VSDGKDIWKDLGKLEGTLDSFRNQIRDLWKKADEREEVDARQDAKIEEIEGRLKRDDGGRIGIPWPRRVGSSLCLRARGLPQGRVGAALCHWWVWVGHWLVDLV